MTKYDATLNRSSWLALVPQSFDTDRQLLQQFAVDGTQDAFAVLVRRHAGMVFRVCRRTLSTVQDAEDACQATFLILARKAADRWQESVSNWLFTTARRVARDARRATERRERRERRAAVPEAVQSIDQLTARELLTAVDEELDRLPPLYREPLVLHYLEELARDEIAARLGVPTGTVKIRLERGRKRLHAALTKRGINLGVGLLTLAITSPAGASPPRMTESILAAVSGRPSAAVAALARGVAVNGSVMKTMLGMAVIAAIATVTIAFGTTLFAARPDPASSPLPTQPTGTVTASDPQAPQAGVDAHGDPLPAGALLRIGTIRFRDGGGTSQAALSPDGKVIATASEATITLFDLATGRRLLEIADSVPNGYTQNGSVFTFAPDGKKLYTLSAPGAPTLVSSGSIIAYDLATGNKLVTFFKPPPKAPGQNKQPDMGYQRLWFPAGTKHLVADREGMTILLDPDTGKEIKTLAFETEMLQATPDGLRLFAIPEKGLTVVVHDGDGKVLRTLEHIAHPVILGFDPAGVTVAAATAATGPESKVRVWELATGKVLVDVTVTEKNRDKDFPITALTISPDRKTVLAGTPKGVIYRFDIASGKELPPLRGHFNFVTGLFFTDGGKILVSSSWDQRVIRWDLAAGKSLPDLNGYVGNLQLDRSPDGKLIAAADSSGTVELLDGVTGRRVRLLQAAGKPATGRVAFGPGGRSLATAHDDAKIRIWEPATGRLVREIEIVDALKRPKDQNIWFPGLAFAPDGRTLVASGYEIGIYAFDTGTGKLLWSDPNGSGSLTFLPDGRSIVVGEWASQLHFRDLASGKKGVSIPCGHFIVYDIAASPDGKLLASGHHDGFVCLRDPATGAIQKEWQAHKRNEVARGVSFGPGGLWLASAGDRTVALWDVATGTLLHRFEGHVSRANSVRFALDGRTLLSSSMDLTGYVWDLRPKLGPTDARTAAQLWDDLAGEPQAAFRAVWLAAADPKAPAVFGEKIPSPPKLDVEKFQKLVVELASSDFKTREAAEKEMSGFGPSALGLAKKASEGADSQEAKVRLDRLIRSWSGGAFTPDNWRRRRAVVAMELAGTPASRELLKRWATDVPGTVLSDAAVAALARLEQLDKSNPR